MFSVCLQLFVIVDLVMSRIGFSNTLTQTQVGLGNVDHQWLNVTSVCSYTFILTIFLICYLLGDDLPVRMVRNTHTLQILTAIRLYCNSKYLQCRDIFVMYTANIYSHCTGFSCVTVF